MKMRQHEKTRQQLEKDGHTFVQADLGDIDTVDVDRAMGRLDDAEEGEQ